MTSQSRAISIGIVGLGVAGSALLPAIARHPHVQVAAACGRNEERLRKFAADYNAHYFLSVEDMCRSPYIDAVYIASPTHMHGEHVKVAAEYKKHIIVEKPMAVTLTEAWELIDAADRNGVHMIVGHSHSFEPPIRKIREIVKSGELGPLKMIHNWYYNDWIYRPRVAEELDTAQGGGVTFRQGSHQFDIIRYIGGGKLRSVRAMTGAWDPDRPAEGAHAVFLEFENGAAATAVYNGYDHFHTTELTFGIGEGGPAGVHSKYGSSRKKIKGISQESEKKLKSDKGYGGAMAATGKGASLSPPFFGLTLASCEKGDIRQSPHGLYIYGEEEKYEIKLSGETGRDVMISELYHAVAQDIRPEHDGRWGLANLEVCLAVLESSRGRKEVFLQHQISLDD